MYTASDDFLFRCLFIYLFFIFLFFSSFRDDPFCLNVKVDVRCPGDLTVEFFSNSERDEDKLLCEMDVTLPPQSSDPDVSAVI